MKAKHDKTKEEDVVSHSTLQLTKLSMEHVGNGTNVGDTVTLVINFDGAVEGLTSSLTDSIFTVGGVAVDAVWRGIDGENSRTLTYTVAPGDNGALVVNGTPLTNALMAGITDTEGHAFFAEYPFASMVNHSVISTVSNDLEFTKLRMEHTGEGTSIGDIVTLTIDFNEAVKGLTSSHADNIFTVGGVAVDAVWSGIDGGNSRTLTYTVASGDNGILAVNGTSLTDALMAGVTDTEGNAFFSQYPFADMANYSTINTVSDDLRFTKLRMEHTGEGTSVGDIVTLTIDFNEAVKGLTSSHADNIFTVGGVAVDAVWSGIDGGNSRTLTYTVASGDNGILAVNGTSLTDALMAGVTDTEGNTFFSQYPFADMANYSTINTADNDLQLTKLSMERTGDDLHTGDTVIVVIGFNEAVKGLTSGLTDSIFTVGGVAVDAVWRGIDGENSRTLTYTVAPGDNGALVVNGTPLTNALMAGITDTEGHAFFTQYPFASMVNYSTIDTSKSHEKNSDHTAPIDKVDADLINHIFMGKPDYFNIEPEAYSHHFIGSGAYSHYFIEPGAYSHHFFDNVESLSLNAFGVL
ncbi:hypothetical protein MS2017_1403 [Bathymodiolus thermophilus thioautotrophic gill symbiont]|uniref:Uncharacterized protein n=1 Tax=Bathymodiolus thermophilus thioautotrophic gill symbiont TaxID=2360 RepID=A0A3G3IMR9_9GAMM|nr:hypothetical protein [Bathymodiolus thermophilus thioautotrophic gill symbiont]AYQ57091.1 hypothetical protein MS2017_1403 [Bathymodiolus thermophilus thioautotrophic gill symbiont]